MDLRALCLHLDFALLQSSLKIFNRILCIFIDLKIVFTDPRQIFQLPLLPCMLFPVIVSSVMLTSVKIYTRTQP
jgi:hypothetical protein